MEVSLLRGALPEWAAYGYGDGVGYGDGYGYGYGYGDGYGDGYGYGIGDGDGYGIGDGDGYGYGIVACAPMPVRITDKSLAAAAACPEGVALFRRLFPTGVEWPASRAAIEAAGRAGLDVDWARRNLGLLEPVP